MNEKTKILRTFQDDCYIVNYPVHPKEVNSRLDQFINHHLPSFSREFIKKKIEKKEIIIQNRRVPCHPSTKVKKNDRIVMHCHRSSGEDEFWRGEKISFGSMQYIHKSHDFLVISKPPFMSTHPTGKHLFHCVTIELEKENYTPFYGVHRLDRETSGILLFPRTPSLARSLTDAFKAGTIQKCYFFIAHKKVSRTPLPFTARQSLDSSSGHIQTLCFDPNSKRGKTALTYFSCICEDDFFVLGLAVPKTGRQHQIRAHAAHHGYPLLGDKIYHGGLDLFGRFKDKVATNEDYNLMEIPRHGLHALGIAFPYKGHMHWVIDQLPKDLMDWIERKTNFHLTQDIVEKKVMFYFKDFKKL